jgi:hypothetical protein
MSLLNTKPYWSMLKKKMRNKFFFVVAIVLALFLGHFVESRLLDNRSYSFPEFDIAIKKDLKDIKTEIKSGDTRLELSLPISNVKTQKSGNSMIFDGVNTAVNYEVKKSGPLQGLKGTIVLKNENAAKEYSFSLKLENVSSFKKDKDNVWHFYNNNNDEIFYIPKGVMEDSKGAFSDLVKIDVTKNGKNYFIKLTADSNWVEDPFRSFPIKINSSVLAVGPKLQLIVTNVGRFRWKLAVEYEIKDKFGKVLGSDVLILDVFPGESNKKISGFLKDYLTTRLAKWAIAQGNYTLREMSNDRLSSSHFQKEDNGDDVNDKYKKLRIARKNLIENFKKTDYPAIYLNSIEADSIQNPVYNPEDGLGNPTFSIENEKIGAGTEILRPNGAGDATGFDAQNPGTTFHWDKVDEAVSDDATTYITTNAVVGPQTDYFSLADTALTTETVNSIDVTSVGGTSVTGKAGGGQRAGVRLSSINTYGTSRDIAQWSTSVDSSLSRPGGGSWAISDLNSLQVALEGTPAYYISVAAGCDKTICWPDTYAYSVIYFTQAYVTVNYSVPSTGELKDVRGGAQFRGGVSF